MNFKKRPVQEDSDSDSDDEEGSDYEDEKNTKKSSKKVKTVNNYVSKGTTTLKEFQLIFLQGNMFFTVLFTSHMFSLFLDEKETIKERIKNLSKKQKDSLRNALVEVPKQDNVCVLCKDDVNKIKKDIEYNDNNNNTDKGLIEDLKKTIKERNDNNKKLHSVMMNDVQNKKDKSMHDVRDFCKPYFGLA